MHEPVASQHPVATLKATAERGVGGERPVSMRLTDGGQDQNAYVAIAGARADESARWRRLAPVPILTPQATDFPRWYQEVIAKAELADNGPVRGTMVIRPWGYAIWELLQSELNRRIRHAGAENVYFPLLIPESHLRREAEHVEGFSPELAVVTVAGGRTLEEPVVIRPTSETVFGEYLARWIQSYRDLPLCLNQWANVVRWELRPRLFLRTSEFLWQEGHTAHATEADAAAYARLIHADVYRTVLQDVLGIPVIVGLKTAVERFAGATATLTCEGMMRDGKALQLATSHELGQNFAKAFEITFTAESGAVQHCWTTSWGSSTRMVGGVIMCHGDDSGLRLPPRVAPVQIVIVVVKDAPEVRKAVAGLRQAFADHELRVRVDDRTDLGLGRRLTDWELKGVPVRVEVGPRDLAEGTVSIARRDREGRRAVSLTHAATEAVAGLAECQDALRAEAAQRLAQRTTDVGDVAEAITVAQDGFARMSWADCGESGEQRLNAAGISVRCLTRRDGSIPASLDDEDLVAIIARAY
jgi:prolyl-tRNA synthetase